MLEENPFFLARAQGVGYSRASWPGRRGGGAAATRLGRRLRPPPRAPYSSTRTSILSFLRDRRRLLRQVPGAHVEFRQRSGSWAALDGLPPGDLARPALKSVAQIRIPKGETYARVEGPRGEVGCYMISDGSAKPYRMKWRGASFSNLAILPHIIPGHKVADVVAIMGSVDPVFGEVDR